MSVIDNDLSAKTDEQLAGLERYYLTIQKARAMTDVEAERLNAVLGEQHKRHTARMLWAEIWPE